MEKSLKFEMLTPSPQPFATDDSPPGGFTALLIADEDHLLPHDYLPEQKPPLFLPPPPPETLESLLPQSLLSDKNRRLPSFPHSSFLRGGDLLAPRKRPLEPLPQCCYSSEPQHFQVPIIPSRDDFPRSNVMPTQKVSRRTESCIQSPISDPATLESILKGFTLSEIVAALKTPTKGGEGAEILGTSSADVKGKNKAKAETDRRRRVSEKVRYLGKLLPSEKKMTTVTILEEAHAYIQFLQVQIQALRSMPAYGGVGTAAGSIPGGVGGRLGRLSRQELLQVVVNSPAAQAKLSSDKCCVVSAEQVALLRNMVKQRMGV